MAFATRIDYNQLTDRQIVALAVQSPHNEEAALFLLYDRYRPLLRHIYRNLTSEIVWYDDCVDELFMHLRGRDGRWHALASFEWRSTLGCWLKGVARHKFIETLQRLIENGKFVVSIDTGNGESDRPFIQLPDGGEEEYERRERKVMLMEAIGQMKDDNQRFVILKRLEGYDSNEIALLLYKRWQKHGICKYNNQGQQVIPDAAYVDVCTQRAKANLRLYIVGEKKTK